MGNSCNQSINNLINIFSYIIMFAIIKQVKTNNIIMYITYQV